MATYLLTWHPDRYEWADYGEWMERVRTGTAEGIRWSTGNTLGVESGDRVFLLRQGHERGIVGSGIAVTDVYEDDHWDQSRSGQRARYIMVALDALVAIDDRLPIESLVQSHPEVKWNSMFKSGQSIPDSIEVEWRSHLRSIGYASEVPFDALLPEEVPEPTRNVEGACRQIVVNAYERDRGARDACIAHYGYDCSVCGFEFAAVYGARGNEFIHVHHLRELSTIGEEYQVDPIADLRPVCPNCHAMLHRTRPAMTIEELRVLIADSRNRTF